MHADFVLNRQDRETRPRHGIDVLDAGDLAEHLLHRRRHEVLDLLGARAGKRDQDIRERDVDLRLFLARRHENRENAHQQRRQRQQRRQLVLEEEPSDPAAEAERLASLTADAGGAMRALAAIGSSATRSPGDKARRGSRVRSPKRWPGRT